MGNGGRRRPNTLVNRLRQRGQLAQAARAGIIRRRPRPAARVR